MMMRFLTVCMLGLAASCAGGPEVEGTDLGGPPKSFRGFPPQTLEGIIYAKASYGSHEEHLGVDLLEESVVPVLLRVQLRGRGQDEAQILLSPDRMNLRLCLPDGTVLRNLPYDSVASRLDDREADNLRRRSFRGGLLSPEETLGYVYFALPKNGFEVDGRRVYHGENGIVRQLDIADSLLAFDVSVESEQGLESPFFVGIER